MTCTDTALASDASQTDAVCSCPATHALNDDAQTCRGIVFMFMESTYYIYNSIYLTVLVFNFNVYIIMIEMVYIL